MFNSPVYRFRCSCEVNLYAWAGHAYNEVGKWSLARWQSEHQGSGHEITQERGPKISVTSRVQQIVSGHKIFDRP